jgi:phosphatidylinositol alpha 1,6-mannosyltransferase
VFTGFLGGAELARAVASFDLFVHPGEFETFCQTIQEAMASGVPVVATGRGGPLDLVENSRTGWLYEPGDLAGLRARVMDLMGDDAKRRAFAAAAHASVQGRTWSALGDELVRHYQAVLAGDRAESSGLPAG